MEIEEYSAKIEIAKEQLKAALVHHKQKNYIPAITLAGAADEILGKILNETKGGESKNSLERSVAFVEHYLARSGERLERKEIIKQLNYPRDSLKHLEAAGRLSLCFDKEDASSTFIERAVENLVSIEDWGAVPKEYITYDSEDENHNQT